MNGTITLDRRAVDQILALVIFGGRAIAANSFTELALIAPKLAMTSCKADIVDRTLVVISSADYYLGVISCFVVVSRCRGGTAFDRILTIIPFGCKAIAVDLFTAMSRASSKFPMISNKACDAAHALTSSADPRYYWWGTSEHVSSGAGNGTTGKRTNMFLWQWVTIMTKHILTYLPASFP